MEKEKVAMKIEWDKNWLYQVAIEFLEKFYNKKLEKEWLTMEDMEYITGFSSKWIVSNICRDPRVIEGDLARRMGEGVRAPWRFENQGIRVFLKKYFKEMSKI